MQEKVCCIYDSDEQYAVRLTEAMNDSVDFPYKVLAYTSEEALEECSRKYDIKIFLTAEDTDSELISKIKPQCFFMLGEEQSSPENNYICRYQSVDNIIKELLAGLADNGMERDIRQLKLTAVYSPAGQDIKTVLALGYSMNASKNSRVLYINLEEFAALDSMFEDGGKDLSDALYYYMSDDENKMSKILCCVNNRYGIDYFNPVSCPEDISLITAEDLAGFIKEIEKSGIYKEVVMEIGNLAGNPWEIMSHCDQILIPEPDSEISHAKTEDFMDFINGSRFKNISGMVKQVHIRNSEEYSGKRISLDFISNAVPERGLRELMYG